MNNHTSSNPTPSPSSGPAPEEGHPNSPDSSHPGRCAFDPLCSAINEGARRAKISARNAIPKIKATVSGVAYWLGFGASYTTVFSYTIVKELAPESLKAGCRDGARAGRKTAEDLAFSAARVDESAPLPSASDPSGPTAQPV